MTVPCEKEWVNVDGALNRFTSARSKVDEILRRRPSTYDDLIAFEGARLIEDQARDGWENALKLFSDCVGRSGVSD